MINNFFNNFPSDELYKNQVTPNTDMSTNLFDYVKIYNNIFDQDEMSFVRKLLDKSDFWSKHSYYNSTTDTHVSYNEDELFCIYDYRVDEKLSPLAQYMQNKVWHIIKGYINDINLKWFDGWEGYSPIRFNKYDVNCRMRVHVDLIKNLFDGTIKGVPVLTVLGSVNDDYEGGELVMMNNTVIELKAGAVMVFPSTILYPHYVKPVTSGVRYSYVSWVW